MIFFKNVISPLLQLLCFLSQKGSGMGKKTVVHFRREPSRALQTEEEESEKWAGKNLCLPKPVLSGLHVCVNVLGHGPAVLTAEVASSFPLMPLSKCQPQMTGTWHSRGTQCQSPLFPILPPYFFVLIPHSFRIMHPNPRRACFFFLSLESGEKYFKRSSQKGSTETRGSNVGL